MNCQGTCCDMAIFLERKRNLNISNNFQVPLIFWNWKYSNLFWNFSDNCISPTRNTINPNLYALKILPFKNNLVHSMLCLLVIRLEYSYFYIHTNCDHTRTYKNVTKGKTTLLNHLIFAQSYIMVRPSPYLFLMCNVHEMALN